MISTLELSSIVIMSIFYASVGIKHFTNPLWFVKIVPPVLPYKLVLVYISGFFEITFGVLLLFPSLRYFAGWGLILLLIAIFGNDAAQSFFDRAAELGEEEKLLEKTHIS